MSSNWLTLLEIFETRKFRGRQKSKVIQAQQKSAWRFGRLHAWTKAQAAKDMEIWETTRIKRIEVSRRQKRKVIRGTAKRMDTW